MRRCGEYAKHTLNTWVQALVQKERSRHKLIVSCCMGVYIAISPFIGLHTAMTLFFGWLFALNIPVILAVSWFINNPWTMVPIYALDCMIGNWLFMFLGIDGTLYEPCWMMWLNEFLSSHVGISGISFWAFMIGGNLFAIGMSGILYPVFSYLFGKKRGDTWH